MESSRLAVSLLAPGRPPDQRDMIAFCVVLLTRLVGQPDPVPLAGSGTSLYHTWAQGLPDAAVDGGALGIDEADFEDRYHRQRDRLASLARGVQSIAARIPDGMRSGVLAEWGRAKGC